MLNHLIREEIPDGRGQGGLTSNSDPVTGQAAWYDVRVRITRDEDQSTEHSMPQFEAMAPLPGTKPAVGRWLRAVLGNAQGGDK